MNLHIYIFVLVATLLISCAATASVVPLEKPSMIVKVETGKYIVRGREISVSTASELNIDPPDRIEVTNEEQILSDEKPNTYSGGTALTKTLGPVDKWTRILWAIVPESVKVHSAISGGIIYKEDADYFLNHEWGGMSRINNGAIPKGTKVYIDYAVCLERVDAVQVAKDGSVSIKKGKSASVCPEIPTADSGKTIISNIYITYRTREITKDNICPMPVKDITWHDLIKVSGREHISNTLGLLKQGKPVTVVCWGDSVTEGASPSSHSLCYVEQLRSKLKAAYPKAQINIINAGIGGSNTNARRDGYDKEVLSYNPDLITVEFVNDIGNKPENVKANWDNFISRARQKNPKVEFILLTPHFMTPAWMGNFTASSNAMRKAAEDNNVALGDAANIWANLRSIGIPYEILLANVLNHPNDLGHTFFADTLMALLTPDK